MQLNGSVHDRAPESLGPLVGKVKEYQVETIVDTLCTNMLSDKEQLRDISSIGLKTVISELPPTSTGSTMTANVCKKITAQLTGAIGKQEDVSVQLEALDILSDMLSRLGGTLYSFHSSILNCLLPQLTSPRLAVRKRAIIALGHLVLTCSGNIFSELTEHLLAELKRNESTSTTRTYIQCVAGISRQAGHRIGEHLEKIIPLIVQYCNVEDDELREYCFQAFESFVRRCPKEMDPHIPNVMGLCLKYITFDPNYNYDNEEEEEMMETENGEDEEQESDDEYSDDDDISWKVRRSAAKCLEAVVSSRRDLLQDFYKTLSPVLISRFKEREENVKADIFSAYISLLRQTLPIQSWLHAADASGKDDVPLRMLQNQVPNIVKALHKQLKEKSIKSRQGCFSLLTELANVLPGCLADHVPALIPGIVFSLADKSSSSNMRIDTLSFLHVLLCNHQPEVFHPHIKSLLPPVVTCIGDPFYKITSEALLVTQQLVKVIRPLDKSCTFDAKPYVKDLFPGTLKRLKAADIDQEVKERAISCMGQIIYNLGDHLSTDLQPTLKIFLERLKNEITRLTTVKALTLIASSPLKIDLRPILGEGFPILASFLRKNQRALKLSTLTALDILVKNYSDSLKPAMIESVLAELPALITENDMHVSQVAVMFLTTLAQVYPSCISKISSSVLAEILQLIHSPLLQGGALNAIIDFLHALVLTKAAPVGYAELLKQLTAPIYCSGAAGAPALHKQAYYSVAKCVAALSSACPKEAPATVNQFIQDVKTPKSSSAVKVLAFLSLAEMGRTTNLSAQRELRTVILEAFTSSSEEVKSAASYALGNVSIGNLKEYLPFMLKEIGSQPKRQYLLLHSLKEVISASPADGLKPYVEDIWALLFKHCECTEEGTRNVVAECLGKLTLVNPSELLPRLKNQLPSGSPHARSTVVTAVKFTIADQPQPIDALLKGCIGDFLKTLQDPDLNVRRVALALFNSAAHNKPSLIRDLLPAVLPSLYNETKVRRELIREVEMGPFKHTVDDGLDVRKAAFECMYTLLESCLDRLDIYEYLNHVEDGLKDHYDIRMLTFIMLARLSTLCPSAVLQRLERLVEPLRATCSTKVKAGSVKQEFEKQDELKRSAMRAVAALLTIPEVEKSPVMAEFSSQIRSSPEMASLFESIQKDSASLPTSELMDMS
ncbi:cullin-associated NEDD8-dissociated protein 1-like isoform X2 [Strigops habroptila]|uniref:cullin-associated NEDD8-dissociated protein 1-like isoform X2 n=1 Tax=Strigops habroptila TaxID=2489341 RepID=UPI0011D00F6A|nr:cullin-associated NEDD8-dissociated protein 1-like isoform X2 [Strigops habroptila]XP_030356586.1 cullin-associated NEDD8-dissociated protein 1-like isoform X2 [Strigops habroptila]